MKRAALLVLSWLPLAAMAQTVTEVRVLSDKATYTMKINGVGYLAFRQADAEGLRKSAREAEDLGRRLARCEADAGALDRSTMVLEQVQKNYEAANAKLQALAKDSQQLNEKYSEASAKLIALTKEHEQLEGEYVALTKKLIGIAERPATRQAIDLGVGYVHSGDQSHIVGMAGVGVAFGVRAWVYGGQSTYGAMLGYSF